MNDKIIPALWFDHQAYEAFEFYTAIFRTAAIVGEHGPVVEAHLYDQRFIGINGGPLWHPNPSISFTVILHDKESIQKTWRQLITEGEVLMPLQRYDFSDLYGWVKDRYGINWQLFYADATHFEDETILPSLMFCGAQQGRCESALSFYQSLFPDFVSTTLVRYPDGVNKDQVMYSQFSVRGTTFTAMDSGITQDFSFNKAVSLTITCENQPEIDYFWNRLTADGQESNCGWCQDPFGVSWQIVPKNIAQLLVDPKAMERLQGMKKINISELQQATAR